MTKIQRIASTYRNETRYKGVPITSLAAALRAAYEAGKEDNQMSAFQEGYQSGMRKIVRDFFPKPVPLQPIGPNRKWQDIDYQTQQKIIFEMKKKCIDFSRIESKFI